MVFRLPCGDGYTLTEENEERLMSFFELYPDIPVEMFAIHILGEKKYETLGMKKPPVIGSERMKPFYRALCTAGVKAKIVTI